jgi:hypothetical protein
MTAMAGALVARRSRFTMKSNRFTLKRIWGRFRPMAGYAPATQAEQTGGTSGSTGEQTLRDGQVTRLAAPYQATFLLSHCRCAVSL